MPLGGTAIGDRPMAIREAEHVGPAGKPELAEAHRVDLEVRERERLPPGPPAAREGEPRAVRPEDVGLPVAVEVAEPVLVHRDAGAGRERCPGACPAVGHPPLMPALGEDIRPRVAVEVAERQAVEAEGGLVEEPPDAAPAGRVDPDRAGRLEDVAAAIVAEAAGGELARGPDPVLVVEDDELSVHLQLLLGERGVVNVDGIALVVMYHRVVREDRLGWNATQFERGPDSDPGEGVLRSPYRVVLDRVVAPGGSTVPSGARAVHVEMLVVLASAGRTAGEHEVQLGAVAGAEETIARDVVAIEVEHVAIDDGSAAP